MLLLDFQFLHADICQSSTLCEFKFKVRNNVKKSYQVHFGVFQNFYQKLQRVFISLDFVMSEVKYHTIEFNYSTYLELGYRRYLIDQSWNDE
jgi:hypothetical protein